MNVSASLPCDVVILPSSELAQKAIAASSLLAPYGSLCILEQGKYYPHASLYMLQLKKADIEQVQELLGGIAKEFQNLQLEVERFYQAQCYVDVEHAKSELLVKLKEEVVAAIKPIRNGMREKVKARMAEATGLALSNFVQFDYKYVGELFRPHITFTRLSEEKSDIGAMLPDFNSFDGTFPRIGLFEMGDNGTCIREIASWNLR